MRRIRAFLSRIGDAWRVLTGEYCAAPVELPETGPAEMVI